MNGYLFFDLVNEDGSVEQSFGQKNTILDLGLDRILGWLWSNMIDSSDETNALRGWYGSFTLGTCPLKDLDVTTLPVAQGPSQVTQSPVVVGSTNPTYYKRFGTLSLAVGDLLVNIRSAALTMNTLTKGYMVLAARTLDTPSVSRTWGHAPLDIAVRWPYFFYDSGYTGESEGKAVFGGTPSTPEMGPVSFVALITQGGQSGQSTYRLLSSPSSPRNPSLNGVASSPSVGSLTAFANFGSSVRFRARSRDGSVWAFAYQSNAFSSVQGILLTEDLRRGFFNGLNQRDLRPSVVTSSLGSLSGLAVEAGGLSAWMTVVPVSQADAYQPVVVRATLNPNARTPDLTPLATPEIVASAGLTQATPTYYNFHSPVLHPVTGDLYIWNDSAENRGLFRRSATSGQWALLPGTEGAQSLFGGATVIDTLGFLYWVSSTGTSLVKYDTNTQQVVASYTTASTPALAYPIGTSSFIDTRGEILCVDAEDNLWVAHNTSAAGVSRLSADGTTLTHYNTSAAGSSVFTRNQPGLPPDLKIVSLTLDPLGRVLALPANNSGLGVFEGGQWFHWPASFPASTIEISAFEHGMLMTKAGTEQLMPTIYDTLPLPLASYGWDGSQWVLGHSGTRPTHDTAEPVLHGVTVRFEAGKNYVQDEWFSARAGTGIHKDNLQTLTARYSWYTANLVYTENESLTAAAGLSLACTQDQAFLVCECSEIVAWSATLNGVPCTLQTGAPSVAGQVRVADNGALTFHSADLGKTLNISYYWLKE